MVAGERSETNQAAMVMRQICGKEMIYQINKRGKMRHPLCNFLALDDKNLTVQGKISGVKHVDVEKVRNHQVDCLGLASAPQDIGRVV